MLYCFVFPVGLNTDPLYDGAPLSTRASWLSIYQFALSNRLTDTATQQLLELMQIHCPPSNSCPRTLYKLKKQLGQTGIVQSFVYCSLCMSEITAGSTQCSRRECRRNNSQRCYFSVLPFEAHLRQIFEGMNQSNV